MTHYTVLDVAPKATTEEIKAAYYSKARVHHPDKGGDATKMAELTEAWSILRDKKKRRLYDAQLLLLCKQAAPCKRCDGKGWISLKKGFSHASHHVGCPKCKGSGVQGESKK